MLERSFSQIPGIGPATEQRLWQAGLESWSALLENLEAAPVGTADRRVVRLYLEENIRALAAGEHAHFRDSLGLRDAWRAWETFRGRCVYLDIETDGGQAGQSVTIVGLWNGEEFVARVKERDLEEFLQDIGRYKMVVTFFGASFDLPMLERRFSGFRFDQIHLDLCPTLRRLGLRGGLKSIERQLGIGRADEAAGLTGWDAVKLWNRYAHLDDVSALDRLVAYNREDCVNLEQLAAYAFERLKILTFLGKLEGEPRSEPRSWPPPSRRGRGSARPVEPPG